MSKVDKRLEKIKELKGYYLVKLAEDKENKTEFDIMVLHCLDRMSLYTENNNFDIYVDLNDRITELSIDIRDLLENTESLKNLAEKL